MYNPSDEYTVFSDNTETNQEETHPISDVPIYASEDEVVNWKLRMLHVEN